MIKIKANTASGEETAQPGDTINYSQPNSKTRRGRVGVGVGVAQTLDTQVNQGVVIPEYNYKKANEIVESGQLKPGETKALDFYNGKAQDQMNTLTQPEHNASGIYDGFSIRRLTETECERLQGFPDGWTKMGNYDGVVKEISRTQRYKMCGNAVTTNIVQLIGIKLLNQ